MKCCLIVLSLTFSLIGCSSGEENDEDKLVAPTVPSVPSIEFKQTNYYLHDTSLFTEGLLVHNGELVESTGSPDTSSKSVVGVNDLSNGRFIAKLELDNKKYFGEGIVFLKNKLFQLTYKNQVGFIYDAKTFKLIGNFKYKNREGWGLTTDGTYLIMSDGTDTLTYLNPNNLNPEKYLRVTENGIRRDSINELEYIKGYIFANVWLRNYIVKIDPANGKVIGKVDLSSLAFKAKVSKFNCDVLNGIAYDSTSDHLFITGKLWPYIFEIKLLP